MIKYMLDTDTCIFAINNKPIHVKRMFNAHVGQICISSITLAELVAGAEKSKNVSKNLLGIEGITARLEVIDFDEKAAYEYGQVRAQLEVDGNKIGPLDTMIAAHARSLSLIIITNNVREFKRVEGLRITNWTDQA